MKLFTLATILLLTCGCSNYSAFKPKSTDSEKTPRMVKNIESTDLPGLGIFSYDTGNLEFLKPEPINVRKVGVLLPSDESFSDISIAIRDGLISAWYDNNVLQYKPELIFYSTSSSSIEDIVESAKRDEVEFIIGPLRKALIPRVQKLLPNRIGMLALNVQASTNIARSRTYQFGLTPEKEAFQVAKEARTKGPRMLLITPESEWGLRMSNAYKTFWADLDGSLVSEIKFKPSESNYSALVKDSLNIDLSYSRRNSLRTLLGTKIVFEARRRKDIDVILLAANEAQARQILPQLRFHKAEDVPIFSSSHVYSRFDNKTNNKDLEGLTFGDVPWIAGEKNYFLRKVLEQTQHPANNYPRLFAFGRDAFSILPFLHRMEISPYLKIPGATGDLWLDSERVIHRDLKWFYFKNGKPRWLGPKS